MNAREHARIEELVRDHSWLPGLVRGLVGEDASDDVLQDTWVAALEMPPRVRSRIELTRSWLARVATNFALRRRRSDERRRSRERAGAREEELPSTEDSFERIRLQRSLAGAILTLPEAEQQAVIWCYYEGVEPQEIAIRLGISASTVRSRLQRARQRLRDRIEEEHGGSWRRTLRSMFLVIPLGKRDAVRTAPTLMASRFIALLFLPVVASWFVWSLTSRSAIPRQPLTIESLPEPDETVAALPSVTERRATSLDVQARGTFALRRVSGVVRDTRGRPVPGAHVRLDPSAPSVVADALGLFQLVAPDGQFELRAVDGLTTMFATPLDGEEDIDDACIVAAPAVRVTGRVRSESGAAIPGARIRIVNWLLRDYPDFLGELERNELSEFETDALGEFALEGLPGTNAAQLTVIHPGYRVVSHRLSDSDQHGMEVVLTPVVEDGSKLVGRVTDAFGEPLEGAIACFAGERTRTSAGGAFELAWGRDRRNRLTIVAEGVRPLSRDFSHAEWVEMGRPHPIEFVVEGVERTIEGRVIDGDGHPLEYVAITVERGFTIAAKDSVEQLASGSPNARTLDKTDEHGRFEIRGLLDRAYVISAHDVERGLFARSESVQPGTRGLVLEVPKDGVRSELRGRVVDANRGPVAGARVELFVEVTNGEHGTLALLPTPVLTNERGTFRLRNVPRHVGSLRVSRRGKMPTEWPLETLDATGEVELRLPGRRLVRFVSGGGPLTMVWLTNERDESLHLYQDLTRNQVGRVTWPVRGSNSPVFAVSDSANVLVLRRDGKKRREGIALVEGSITEVLID